MTVWAPTPANQNQGAESTVSFLLSLLAMLEVAGEAAVDSTVPTPPAN